MTPPRTDLEETSMPDAEAQWDGVDRRHPHTFNGAQFIKVPYALLAIIVAILVQSAGGIWLLANMSNKIDQTMQAVNEFKLERYTREDARREREIYDGKLELLRQVTRDLERRMLELEANDRAAARKG